jgi:hypothetical protein
VPTAPRLTQQESTEEYRPATAQQSEIFYAANRRKRSSSTYVIRSLIYLNRLINHFKGRDSAVGTATGWATEGSEFGLGTVRNLPFFASSRPALGPSQPPIPCVPGSKPE